MNQRIKAVRKKCPKGMDVHIVGLPGQSPTELNLVPRIEFFVSRELSLVLEKRVFRFCGTKFSSRKRVSHFCELSLVIKNERTCFAERCRNLSNTCYELQTSRDILDRLLFMQHLARISSAMYPLLW